MLRYFPSPLFIKSKPTVEEVLRKSSFKNPDVGPINAWLDTDYFIICIPKCGTTAIQRGLERLAHNVIHAHTNISTWEAFKNGHILRGASIGMENILAARLAASSRPVHIFFGYREPVSWYLSLAGHFGLELDTGISENIIPNIYSAHPWEKYNIDDISLIIREATGVDILACEFDHEQGLTHIVKDNINLVCYRFDKMKRVENYIVCNVDKRFVLTRERVNENPAYASYKESFKAPQHALDHIDCDRWFRHFYTAAERVALLDTYARGVGR